MIHRTLIINHCCHFRVLMPIPIYARCCEYYDEILLIIPSQILSLERRDDERYGIGPHPHCEGLSPATSALTGRLAGTGDARRPRPCQPLRRTQSGSAANGHNRGGPQRRLSPGRGGRLPPKWHRCQVLRGPHRTGNAIPREQETADETGAH